MRQNFQPAINRLPLLFHERMTQRSNIPQTMPAPLQSATVFC